MERPVRSFKSFIRATPLHASPEKPLTPASPPLQRNTSSSSVTTQNRSTGWSLWEAPSNWDNDDDSQAQSTPPFAFRLYSLLIPEPPEDIAAMQMDPILWQQGNGPFQQTPLDPIHERTYATPDIPPRNPARPSPALLNPAMSRRSSRDSLSSISSRYSTNISNEELTVGRIKQLSAGEPITNLPSPLDLASALSDTAIGEKASNSLSPGSLRDQEIVWTGQHQRSDSVQLEDDSHVDLQGKKLTTFRRASVLMDDDPLTLGNPETSDKLRALSFAQDYHNVLVGQSFDDPRQSEPDAPPTIPPKDHCMTPRPLTWRKQSDGSPHTEAIQRPQMPVTSPGRHKNLRKMSSWVNHCLRKDPQIKVNQRSASDPGLPPSRHRLGAEASRHLDSDTRLAKIVQHGKNLLPRGILRKESEQKQPLINVLPLCQNSADAPEDPSAFPASCEVVMPIFRLPGGLAVVRKSSLPTLRPQATSGLSTTSYSDLARPDFPASSPFCNDDSRRNSWQSTRSQPHAASTSLFKRKFSSPLSSPRASRSFSHSKLSLANPLPQEAPSPYPPQTRRRSHNIGSPLTVRSTSHDTAQHVEDYSESTKHGLNLFERAKNARHAWKKHQKDVRNEKLKQSIILVGPADAKNVAGYIECGGRASGDSGIGQGQLSREMAKEAS